MLAANSRFREICEAISGGAEWQATQSWACIVGTSTMPATTMAGASTTETRPSWRW
jgi:hypothetical protein